MWIVKKRKTQQVTKNFGKPLDIPKILVYNKKRRGNTVARNGCVKDAEDKDYAEK